MDYPFKFQIGQIFWDSKAQKEKKSHLIFFIFFVKAPTFPFVNPCFKVLSKHIFLFLELNLQRITTILKFHFLKSLKVTSNFLFLMNWGSRDINEYLHDNVSNTQSCHKSGSLRT